MKPLARLFGAALVGAFALLATPAAQAQVGVNINIAVPAWGPQVPYGTQYYYIPEIDGYYDLYNQQYIVFQDGYWVPQPELYGYDPYLFHPVIVDYRGPQPWSRLDYYHQRYAYQPYRYYGPARAGYYGGGYGYGYNGYGNYGHPRNGYYSTGRGYYGPGGYRGNDHRGGNAYPGGGYNPPRGNQQPQPPQGGYNPGPGQNPGNHGGFGGGQGQPGGGNHGGGNNGHGGRHGRS
jgi:uncharacterized membrane protein YgcG